MKVFEVPVLDYNISTADQLDGYGYKHIDDIIASIRYLSGDTPVEKALEWCSGPGYIGFALAAIDYAQKVVLSDIHKPLTDVVNTSISRNNLQDRVSFICSDNFNNIPAQKFDLIVGNPPHFNFALPFSQEAVHYQERRKHMDIGWKCHIDFYNNVKEYLAPGGQIILMENVKGSSVTTFDEMIRNSGLRIADHMISRDWPDDIWYIKVVHAE